MVCKTIQMSVYLIPWYYFLSRKEQLNSVALYRGTSLVSLRQLRDVYVYNPQNRQIKTNNAYDSTVHRCAVLTEVISQKTHVFRRYIHFTAWCLHTIKSFLLSLSEKNYYLLACLQKGHTTLWQYGLWSFQMGDTKLERFLPKNQPETLAETIG